MYDVTQEIRGELLEDTIDDIKARNAFEDELIRAALEKIVKDWQ
jgi:hypothetical protein